MDNEIIGTPVKAYRAINCYECKKVFEIDIEKISCGGRVTVICPWCDHKKTIYEVDHVIPGDRVVRCD